MTQPLSINTPAQLPAPLPQTPTLPLEDIIIPDAVSSWPPGPGWWLLGILFIALIVGSMILYRRHQKKWGYRKQALSLLADTLSQWQNQQLGNTESCQHFLQILKRTAITAYPKQPIAALYGKAWLQCLLSQAPGMLKTHKNKAAIETLETMAQIEEIEEIEEIVCSAQYQAKTTLDPTLLYEFCRSWVQKHSPQWQKEQREDV